MISRRNIITDSLLASWLFGQRIPAPAEQQEWPGGSFGQAMEFTIVPEQVLVPTPVLWVIKHFILRTGNAFS